MSKRDDINKLYCPSKIIEKVCFGLFWADVFLYLIYACAQNHARSYLAMSLIIIAFCYIFLYLLDDVWFWFSAESARRKNSIQVAFNVKLDKYETEDYYNNNIADQELKYALNLFESVFFTKEISKKMQMKAYIRLIVAIVVVAASLRLITNDDILLIIVQSAFSTFLIEDSIKMILFSWKVNDIYNKAYHEFITIGISKPEQLVWLRYFCTEYESIKAHFKVRLDEKLFMKLNPSLSEEWKSLLNQIKIELI